MKVIRTRFAVAIASSALMAGGFGLTAIALSSPAQTASSAIASGQNNNSPCPNTTVIDYCSQK